MEDAKSYKIIMNTVRIIMLDLGSIMNKRLLALIFSLALLNVSAQDSKIFKRGEKYFSKGNYVKAQTDFMTLVDAGHLNNDIASYLAKCHLELHKPDMAKDIISRLDSANDFNTYLLAEANYFLEDFATAKRLVELVKDTADIDIGVLKRKINSSLSNYDNSQGYVVQNFGPEINTEDRQYNALMVMNDDFNELLFTTRGFGKGSSDSDGLLYESIYSTTIDSSNNWLHARPLETSQKHENRHDATVQVLGKGTRLISYQDGGLYLSTFKDGVWVKEKNLNLHNYNATDTHCYMSEDESTIIFASDLQSNGHNLDLFMSTKDDSGQWNNPIPIDELNTEYDEDAPFLAGDSTLYFSSRGHGSMGGYDVFKSHYQPKTKTWSKPENLGHPINTVSEDIYFTNEGKLGYLSSTRTGGFGSLDLYRVYLFNKVKLSGYVMDEQNNEPISDVQINLEYDSSYFRSYSDINGRYEMYLPVNKSMKVQFVKDSLNLFEGEYIVKVFFTDENNNEFNFRINYSDTTDNPIAYANLKASQKVKHIKVNVKNSFTASEYELSVPSHMEKSWADSVIMANDYAHEEYLKNLKPKEPIVDETIVVEKQRKTLILYYPTNSFQPTAESTKLLQEFGAKKITGLIEINGHTGVTGNALTNKRLSTRRAQTVFKYLVDQGFDPDSLVYKGYGSDQLLDTRLTTEAHNRNRRTEIIYYE